ncbi:MAG: carbohydrate-binding protein [Acidobacteria bacterium]|nr:carbohydrate-binding protein [Acidobacteriota bacterium]
MGWAGRWLQRCRHQQQRWPIPSQRRRGHRDERWRHNVGWTNNGEWLKYTLNVTTTGTYTLSTRLASAQNGATFHVEIDGVNKTGTVAVPNTGGWTVFTTISTPNITLSKGQHVMKVVFDIGGGNFNWFDWALTTAGGTTTPTSAINNLVYAVSATNNRLGVPAGQSGAPEYDAAGNQTRDTFTQSGVARFSYDAENRLKTVMNDTQNFTYATYTYDGDGKRVKRLANSVETWQAYGIGGELLAEYAASGAASSPQKEYGYRNGQLLVTAAGSTVTWLMPDQLGSTRLELAASGAWNAVTRHDYLPFGEELGANVGVRGNAGSGYAVSAIRQRFGAYERDTETGLDFAQARYCASVQGRFTGVDPLMASASAIRPQSWNRYSYSYNNPLRFSDPTGMLAGDFYNQNGKKIGTDGIDDGKAYIVTNDKTAKQIEKTKGNTPVSSVSSSDYIEAPDAAVRDAIGTAVQRGNSKTTDDTQGGFHEEGGQWGLDASGNQAVVPAKAGSVSNPQKDSTATIKTGDPANSADAGRIVNLQGTFHIHPKGEVVIGPGPGVIGGTTTTYNFNQPPSSVDIGNATTNNIVVGARDKTVYFYNNSGQRGTFPLNQFLKLGKK